MGQRANKTDSLIGERIHAAREQAGLTMEQLGEHIGVTRQMVANYERGHIRVAASVVHEIARVCRKRVSFFFP